MRLDRAREYLKAERGKLDRAIAALEPLASTPEPNGRRRRGHSADAKRRIGEAMRRRWAERRENGDGWAVKKGPGRAAPPPPPKRKTG